MTQDILTEIMIEADPVRGSTVAVPSTATLMSRVHLDIAKDRDHFLPADASAPVRASGTRHWLTVAAAIVVFVAALVGIELVPVADPPAAQAAITLAAFHEELPTPWVLTDPPAGVSGAHFSGGPSGVDAVYLDDTGSLPAGDIYVITGPDRPVETVQFPVEELAVNGTTGYVDTALSQADLPRLEVSWRATDGQWVTVAGNGTRAKKSDVLALAAHVHRGEPVTSFSVMVAPKGWHLTAFKDDNILTIAPDTQPAGQNNSLTVTFSPQPDDTFPAGYPPGEVTNMTSSGRPGHLLELASGGGWIVDLQLPTRATVRIIVDADLSRDQILRIADGVELRQGS